ncbi:FAD-dependent oxidoreductase [Paenibacillus sp. NPDC056579]|uniref:FAD-dependent oxidoreductase n=1 Tax=Paenibacillus sp. NPDC056579 TaxID=3345871 RepID=UPI0036A278BB
MNLKRWIETPRNIKHMLGMGAALGVAGGAIAVLGYFGLHRDSDGSFTLNPNFSYTPEVVVVGTELEGMYLAQRAKQEGLDVLILETKAGLGGQLLQGEMLYLDGTYDDQGQPLAQGGMKELFRQYERGDIRRKADFAGYFHRLVDRIPLEKSVVLEDVQTESGKVVELQYVNRNGKKRSVRPDYVVDNSDDASLIRTLKVEPFQGLEALYGSKEREYMSATYMMKFKGVDWHKFYSHFWSIGKAQREHLYGPETYVDANIAYGFPPIVSAYELRNKEWLNLRGLNILNQGNGEIVINALQVYGVDPSQEDTVQRGMRLTREEMPYIRDHLRKHIVGFENLELNGEPAYLYIREYNHYPTEYVMQASDIMSGRMFWDNVSIGGYFLDIQGSRSNREGLAIGRPDKYGIPLGSYLLKPYDNVVTAGKLVGSSAVAYGSTRIQPNGAIAAESIGVLMAQMQGRSLKSADKEDMERLHNRMESRYGVQLKPQKAANKIAHLSEEEKRSLDAGALTLLPGNTVAKHLPFTRIYADGRELPFRGIKPLVIRGMPWVPLTQTFRALGIEDAKYDPVAKRITYTEEGRMRVIEQPPVHILNNFVLTEWAWVADALGYQWQWNEADHVLTAHKAFRP